MCTAHAIASEVESFTIDSMFIVGGNGELATLHNVEEMVDGQIYTMKFPVEYGVLYFDWL